MSFLAPAFLWMGIAAAAIAVAIHFVVTRQPRAEAFPTARFVPDSSVKAVSQATRPTDLLILLLRLLAIMSIAAAFARPVLSHNRQTSARIILADVSRSSRSLAEVRDSAKQYFRSGDLVVGFDSVPRSIESPDSLMQGNPGSSVGNLSAALIAALRASMQLRDKADSVSLILVSAMPAEMLDPATDTIRSLWPGAMRIVRVTPRAASDPAELSPVRTTLAAGDPLRYSIELAAKLPHARDIRVIRSGALPVADGHPGEVLLHWPVSDRPRFSLSAPLAVHGGLVVGKTVIVAPFRTAWAFPADSMKGATVIGRWVNGVPAVIQQTEGARCIRSTTIPVSSKGDWVIRQEFVALVQALLSSCETDPDFTSADDAAILRLKGGTAAASRNAFPASPQQKSPYAPWLFLTAIALLISEQFARRTLSRNTTESGHTDIRAAA